VSKTVLASKTAPSLLDFHKRAIMTQFLSALRYLTPLGIIAAWLTLHNKTTFLYTFFKLLLELDLLLAF
jgi:hypothetical protein